MNLMRAQTHKLVDAMIASIQWLGRTALRRRNIFNLIEVCAMLAHI